MQLVTEDFAKQTLALAHATNPFRDLFPAPEYQPLTWRQRFRVWRSDLRWSVHNWLFPDCDHGSDY